MVASGGQAKPPSSRIAGHEEPGSGVRSSRLYTLAARRPRLLGGGTVSWRGRGGDRVRQDDARRSGSSRRIGRRGQVLVIVPTIELMHQWHRHMRPALPPGYSVGCLGDSETGSFATHDIIIGVVNSLRDNDVRMTRRGGLLVADECHRYASAMNRLALDERFERRLGLSATYARDDDGHVNWLDPFFRGTCFRMGYRRAVDDGVTAHFTVALVGVALPGDERAVYEELTLQIGLRHARLMKRYHLPTDSFGQFIRALNLLASGTDSDTGGASQARAYLGLLLERRRLLGGTSAKTRTLAELAPAIASADRSIVFTGSIETAEIAASALDDRGLRAESVHSRLAMGTAERCCGVLPKVICK